MPFSGAADPLERLAETRDAQLGPYLTGCVVQQLMQGILMVQIWDYYRMFPHDSLWNKGLVAFLMFAGIWQAACCLEMLYSTFVIGYGDLVAYDNTHFTWWSECAFTSFVACACQSFFLHRAYTATRSKILVLVTSVSMITSLGAGIATSVGIGHTVLFTRVNDRVVQIPAAVWFVSSAFTDVLISAYLVFFVRRSATGLNKSTDEVVSSIMRLTMETGSLTTIHVVLNLLIYFLIQNNSAYISFQLTMGKIYSHSVLVTLIARVDLRAILATAKSMAPSQSAEKRSGMRQGGETFQLTRTHINVETHVVENIEESDPKVAVAPFEYNGQAPHIYVGEHKSESASDSKSSFEHYDHSSTAELRKDQGAPASH